MEKLFSAEITEVEKIVGGYDLVFRYDGCLSAGMYVSDGDWHLLAGETCPVVGQKIKVTEPRIAKIEL